MQRFLIFIALLLTAFAAKAADAPDLLAPQAAFRLSAKMETGDELLVRFAIAPGYYLYRNKLQFSVEPGGVTLGTPRKPKGRLQEDEFFGRVEIYRADVVIHIPVKLPPGSHSFTLLARSQGCADAGVCYTPQQQKVVIGPGMGERVPDGAPGDGRSLVDSLGGDTATQR